MDFPTILNIELTNRCNKNCGMCGRRKREKNDKEYYNKYSQDIPFGLLEKISNETKGRNILIQFHGDGEPTLYPKLESALKLFEGNIRAFNTNGILLYEKRNEIINNLETLTLSTFENDVDYKEQWQTLQNFLSIKGNNKPRVIIRALGNQTPEIREKFINSGLLVTDRILHAPEGSGTYKKETVIPEHGICLEALMHPAINVNGDLSQCVRYDPDGINILGNLHEQTIEEIGNGSKRKKWLNLHINGKRNEIPMCLKCEFGGIPKG